MRKTPLGTSGESVSVMCLGAMLFGSQTDERTSYRLLDYYREQGGSFLDTANIYAWWIKGAKGGESEILLGKWMKERRNRSELFIASKVGFEMPGVERGLRAQQIEEECEKSLKRLGVNTIDLYYAHKDDYDTPVEETLEAFYRLIRSGKIRYIGASNFSAWRLEQAHNTSEYNGWTDYCCVQQRYTYLRPHTGARFDPQLAVNSDLLHFCSYRKKTLLAYTPLLEGAYIRKDKPLSQKYIGPDSKARLRALKSVVHQSGATVNQVVLAWMLRSLPPVIPVFGVSNMEQLRENIGALDIRLDQDQLNRLNRASA
jgi:aryl-alcohol dehydrogenase-like predicted oxidoreductase